MSSHDPSTSSSPSRGEAVRVRGLPKQQHRLLKRACELRGLSMSSGIQELVDDFIADVQEEFGNLFKVLTPKEKRVIRKVKNGANTLADIAQETRLRLKVAEEVIAELVRRGELVERNISMAKQGPQVYGYFLPQK